MESIVKLFCVAVIGAFALYVIVKAAIEGEKRRRYRKKNLDAQFSGSAETEEKGFWETLFTSRYGSRAEAIGARGEGRVSSVLADLPCEDYWVFNDILIRNGDYTTQVDHLIISRYGVFVIETKTVHGKVYGSGGSEYWKQYLPDTGYKRFGFTQEHQLRNPLWQNAGHIKALRRLVFGNDVPVYGLVVFPNSTEIHVTASQLVFQVCDVVPFIRQYRDIVLSSEQMDYYRSRLLGVISTSGFDRVSHLDNVRRTNERRDAAVASGRCPKCGGNLVLRNGRYGRFYGCSNYPRCTYKLKQ